MNLYTFKSVSMSYNSLFYNKIKLPNDNISAKFFANNNLKIFLSVAKLPLVSKKNNLIQYDFLDKRKILNILNTKLANENSKQKYLELKSDLNLQENVQNNTEEDLYLEKIKLNSDDTDNDELKNKVELQRKKVLTFPEKYVNGEYNSEIEMIIDINNFFEKNYKGLILIASFLDKESFNYLLRLRLNKVEDYIKIIQNFKPDELELLEKINDISNQDNKPLLPAQKMKLIDLIEAYKANDLDIIPIKKMMKSGQINLGELQINIFNQILKSTKQNETEYKEVSEEKLMSWDYSFAHLLSKTILENQDIIFKNIINIANSDVNFINFIHDTNNIYGKTNLNTQNMFIKNSLNYDKWINPSKENEINIIVKDKNQEQLIKIANQITENIEMLRYGNLKKFIDKQCFNCIKNDKFVITSEIAKNKIKLKEFTINLIKQLDSVWKRAKHNSINSDLKYAERALKTLIIFEDLKQKVENLSNIDQDSITKNIALTIKMWDRLPQKDLFQGNYSTCCIKMGGTNASAMPHYIVNTAFNMIEILDNNEIIGNALCYFIIDEDGKIGFVIDNIEINNSLNLSDDIKIKLRNQITKYASKLVKEVTGNDNTNIYLGENANDVPDKDLQKLYKKITLIGDVDSFDVYLDAYCSKWVLKNELTKTLPLLKLK